MVGLLGYFFGQNLALLEHYLGTFGYVILALVVLGGIIFFVIRRQRKPPELTD